MAVSGVLHRVFVFLIMPVLGYLLGATIFNHFWDKVETEGAERADLVVTALSCKQYGPVTLRGFGFVDECWARVGNRVRGDFTITTARGYLKPHLIGERVVGREFTRGVLTPERPSAGWGVAWLLVFAAVWLYLSFHITRLASPLRLRRPRDRVR